MAKLDPRTTALVLIDLQKGILAFPLAPRSGAETLANATALAATFHSASALVVLVRVAWAPDFADAPPQAVDRPLARPPGGLPADWSELDPELAAHGSIVVTKRHWGAFHGTDLDLQLRRRGVRTVVLGGIATSFGVESTARSAHEHGYEVVVAEEAATSLSEAQHLFSIGEVLPRIARISRCAEISLARN